jgi:hypothetical protein
VPLWQFQGFCVDVTLCTWSKCRFADAMLTASHRMAVGHAGLPSVLRMNAYYC